MSLVLEPRASGHTEDRPETRTKTALEVPLIVGLDGGLLLTRPLHESIAALLSVNPAFLFLIPVWLMKGFSHIKQQLATRVSLDASVLPYNQEFWQWLKEERRNRTTIYMVTSATESDARAIAGHLGLFDGFVANYRHADSIKNKRLSHESGIFDRVFDYAGNSEVPELLQVRVSETGRDLTKFAVKRPGWRTYAHAMRVHQWPKNLLVFVPLITSHQLLNPRLLGSAVLAAVAFSLCASCVYVINDLTDLKADRTHSTKRHRAFASGKLALPLASTVRPFAVRVGMPVDFFLPPLFRWVLCAYLMLTCLYSVWLKKIVLIDVFVLAGLYTSRLIAGSAAYGVELSNWLLSFSMFLFLKSGLLQAGRGATQD